MKEHNEFNTKVGKDNYTITFNTNDQKRYEFVEKACRAMVDRNDTTVFIELPCAVGDTVYYFERNTYGNKYIKESKVIEIIILERCIYFKIYTGKKSTCDMLIEYYNKEWFTDRAKAEERLEELNHEN